MHTLRGVNLTIDHGELAAMVSPPGSGKTSLLHLMATLDRPSRARIGRGQLVDEQALF